MFKIKIRGKNARTPLHYAADNGEIEAVKALIKAKAKLVNIRDKNNQTALHLAADNGEIEAVNALIEANAQLDIRDKNNQTPLHLAAANGKIEAVNALKEVYDDLNISDKEVQNQLINHMAFDIPPLSKSTPRFASRKYSEKHEDKLISKQRKRNNNCFIQ